MLTSRAWWFLVILLGMLAIALLGRHPVLLIVSLGLLLWFCSQGLLFSYRARCIARGLVLSRQVRDERGVVSSLWAGHTFEVRLVLRLREGALPYLAWEDFLPASGELLSGKTHSDGQLESGSALALSYTFRALHPGKLRFEGARVLLADLCGMFYHATFVRSEVVLRVLPSLVDAEGKTATTKRYNLLPPPGINRLPRPGAGSELLDLRDYLPGDPPKTIAWKVSARRDRLITKEYESEVPVRCTLFVDTSNAVRLGPSGSNALARLVEIASAVAQANMTARDLTGLCIFDETQVMVTKPARTRRHLVQLYNQLADAAGLAPASGSVHLETLLPLAYSFAREVYPEQLDPAVNRMPGWMPFFIRLPSHWVTRVDTATRFWRWLAVLPAGVVYLGIAYLGWLGLLTAYDEALPQGWREELFAYEYTPLHFLDLATLAYWLLLGCVFPLFLLIVRDALPLFASARQRRFSRYRKRLAALFSRRYELGPGGLELLAQEDRTFGIYLGQFLSEHQIEHTPALYDRDGRYQFASPEKIVNLGAQLLRAVGKGHDNELFVLLVDLVELEQHLEPLLRAVKVALARHHQVMVVCPWPPELEPPGVAPPSDELPLDPRELAQTGKDKQSKSRRNAAGSFTNDELRRFLRDALGRHYHRAFHRIRRTFARVQVPVVCAAAEDSVQLILDRLDRLRGMRRRR